MFIRVRANFCYNLEHHTTLESLYMTGESDFCRFLPSVLTSTRDWHGMHVKIFCLLVNFMALENFFEASN